MYLRHTMVTELHNPIPKSSNDTLVFRPEPVLSRVRSGVAVGLSRLAERLDR